jgi:hypothetical protein
MLYIAVVLEVNADRAAVVLTSRRCTDDQRSASDAVRITEVNDARSG